MRPIDKLVVHCSATKAGRDFGAADIDRWHRESGYAGIGYHYVIRIDGTVELGRGEATVGAHAVGFNANSIGICLIGGLDQDGKPSGDYTTLQWTALAQLLNELRERFPDIEILGHRDLPKVAKDCPCFDVRAWCVSRGIDPKRG